MRGSLITKRLRERMERHEKRRLNDSVTPVSLYVRVPPCLTGKERMRVHAMSSGLVWEQSETFGTRVHSGILGTRVHSGIVPNCMNNRECTQDRNNRKTPNHSNTRECSGLLEYSEI